jgi:hypothetical protein
MTVAVTFFMKSAERKRIKNFGWSRHISGDVMRALYFERTISLIDVIKELSRRGSVAYLMKSLSPDFPLTAVAEMPTFLN